MKQLVILLLITAVVLLGCSSKASPEQSATAAVDADLTEQDPAGSPQLDRSKPVPPKAEIIKTWQKRQDAMKTFRFAWTEQQTHPKGWIPNPRYRQLEWSNIPGLLTDRNYSVAKTLAVDGDRMRYSFEIDREAEPDGVRVKAEGNTRADGLGVRRNYSYISVFDGQRGMTRLTSLMGSPPPALSQGQTNVDAQNLDTRVIMMALRPLDPVLGHLLIDRAVTNRVRTFYKGKSTMLLEEQHDPSGWKTVLRIEPERDFLVTEYLVLFEQKIIVDIDIDYTEDARWGWVPSGWRVTQMLADGARRLVAEAKVSSYSINQPLGIEEFK